MRTFTIVALGLSALLVFSACSKSSDQSNTSAESTSASEASAAPAESASAAPEASASSSMAAAGSVSQAAGAKVFTTNCASCHQSNGKGLPGSFPPLAGSPIVTGDPTHLIHIIKYGLTGSVQVEGQTYNGQMPAWSSQLSNGDIAAVATYIRSSWGNAASAITEAQVSAVSQ